MLGYILVLGVIKASLELNISLSWSGAMHKVYGTFIFVPGLDLGTCGLDPNTVKANG